MQDTYEQGEALYFGEEYAEAEPLLRRAAEAVVWLRRAAERGSQSTAAYNLGIFLEEDGELQEAEHWYRQATECLYHPAARNRLALLLERTGRDGEAETWYRTALEEMAAHEDPDDRDDDYEANSEVMLNLADLLERTARPDEARDLRRRAAGRVTVAGGE